MGNEEEWQGDESITILIVAAHTARHSSLVSSPTPPCYCTTSSGLLGLVGLLLPLLALCRSLEKM